MRAKSFNEGFAPVCMMTEKGDPSFCDFFKWGIINKKGEEIIAFKYDTLKPYQYGFASVKLNGKWGIINYRGIEVISCKYDEIGEWLFTNERTKVKLAGKWGYIDKKGQEVIPLIYDDAGTFNYGWAAVLENKKWGFIDTDGNILTPFRFDDISLWENSDDYYGSNPYCWPNKYKVKFDGVWRFIDKKGNYVEY